MWFKSKLHKKVRRPIKIMDGQEISEVLFETVDEIDSIIFENENIQNAGNDQRLIRALACRIDSFNHTLEIEFSEKQIINKFLYALSPHKQFKIMKHEKESKVEIKFPANVYDLKIIIDALENISAAEMDHALIHELYAAFNLSIFNTLEDYTKSLRHRVECLERGVKLLKNKDISSSDRNLQASILLKCLQKDTNKKLSAENYLLGEEVLKLETLLHKAPSVFQQNQTVTPSSCEIKLAEEYAAGVTDPKYFSLTSPSVPSTLASTASQSKDPGVFKGEDIAKQQLPAELTEHNPLLNAYAEHQRTEVQAQKEVQAHVEALRILNPLRAYHSAP